LCFLSSNSLARLWYYPAPNYPKVFKGGIVFGLKQPVLGIVATVFVMVVSLALISLFDFSTFAGWMSYGLMCLIPMQIVVGVTWGANQPNFAAKQRQPLKGVLLTLTTVVIGAIVVPAYLAIAGGNVKPPSPMLMHATITSVVVTFWAAIIFGGWPFKTVIKNEVGAGLVLVAGCYLVNYLFFRMFFDYGFMQGAPVYVASLDPHGMFSALNALVFEVSFLIGLFMMASFDLWPLTKFPAVMQQPVLGIVWTIVALAIGGLAFLVGVGILKMDVMAFLVTVPVPYIFGTIVVLNMFQNSLFGKLAQPMKGLANVIAVVVIGGALAQMYRALAPTITAALHAGPPTYDLEIWTASALLAVTFPFLIFFAEFFKFWPLTKTD
jgi:hypothetical protein